MGIKKELKQGKTTSILILIILLTPLFGLKYDYNKQQNENFSDSQLKQIDPATLIDNQNFENKLKLSYTPISSLTQPGDNFDISENLSVYHPISLSLNSGNSWSDSYAISSLAGYTDDSLKYDLTVSASQDMYVIQNIDNKDAVLDSGTIRVAQAFEISWDYAMFYGAEIYLGIDGSILGSDELELFLVKEDVSGEPNMADIRSNDTDDPYNTTNHLPASSSGNYAYYDFHDVVLENGKYFIVANLSVIDDSNDEFNWRGQQGASVTYPNYLHDGSSWSLNDEIRDLIVDLKPTYANGTAKIFTDLTEITLQDNLQDITSSDQLITSTGLHTLTCDTSVDISSNNSYYFSRSFVASSSFQATNSSYYQDTISWTISWVTPLVDFSPYTNPTRYHEFLTPTDWDNSSFSFLYNGITPLVGNWMMNGYQCELSPLISGSQYLSGDLTLVTSSPNYVFDTTLNSESFNLGYWTTNGIDAFGHNGSTITSNVFVKERVDLNALDGELNFTLFDPNGNIIALKSSVPANIVFTDVTDYTLITSTQESPGQYSVSSVFDPSIYGTDSEGFWTVASLWNNGTEGGFFSKRISVGKSTSAEFAWETSPSSDNWTNDTFTQVTRINGEDLKVRVSYYNISDPFFSGIGTSITGGTVSYNTSWQDTASLSYIGPFYEYTIPLDLIASDYEIDLDAAGDFLQNHTISFSLKVYHQFQVEKIESDHYTINYTNSVPINFRLLDISNASVPVLPDNIAISRNGSSISSSDFSTTILGDIVQITLNTGDIGLGVGFHLIEISASKTDFIESYSEPNAKANFIVQITPIIMQIQAVTTNYEIYHNNQTSISFTLIDTNHSTPIAGATVLASFDIEEAEVVTIFEDEPGLYTIVFRVYEPTVSSLNLFVDVSKPGYEAHLEFLLSSVNIKIPTNPITPPPEGIPPYIIVIVVLAVVATIATITFFVMRTRLHERRQIKQATKSKIRDIYQSTFMIKRLLIVHHETSSPVFEIDIDEQIAIDPSIISGVLQAISSIGQEMVGSRTGIRKIEYYGFVITTASSGAYTAYMFSDTELVIEIEQGLQNLTNWFDVIFGYEGVNWQGSMDIFKDYQDNIMEKVVEDLYLWLLYPVEVLQKGLDKIGELDTVSQRIISFINDKGSATAALIMDQLKEYEKEEILSSLYSLANEEYLKRNIREKPTNI